MLYCIVVEKYFPAVIMTIWSFHSIKRCLDCSIFPYGTKSRSYDYLPQFYIFTVKNYLVQFFCGTIFLYGISLQLVEMCQAVISFSERPTVRFPQDPPSHHLTNSSLFISINYRPIGNWWPEVFPPFLNSNNCLLIIQFQSFTYWLL